MKNPKHQDRNSTEPLTPPPRDTDEFIRLTEHAHNQIEWIWKNWLWLGGFITVLFIVIGIIYWKTLEDFKTATKSDLDDFASDLSLKVNERIDKEFQAERIHALVAAKAIEMVDSIARPAIASNMAEISRTQLEPLKTATVQLSERVEHANRDFDVFQIFLKAQAGNAACLRSLTVLATNDAYISSKVLASALNDLNSANGNYKRAAQARSPYFRGDRRPIEDLYSGLDLDEVSARQLTCFVEDIVSIVTNANDTGSQIDAVVALERLTGLKFAEYPPFDDVVVWWSTSGKTNTLYRSLRPTIQRGIALVREGRADEAVQVLSNAAARCEGFAVCHRLMGDIYLAKNELQLAEDEFHKAISQADEQAEAYGSYAAVLLKQNKKQEALNALKKIIDDDLMREAQVKGDPRFKELHNDPTFKRIIDED